MKRRIRTNTKQLSGATEQSTKKRMQEIVREKIKYIYMINYGLVPITSRVNKINPKDKYSEITYTIQNSQKLELYYNLKDYQGVVEYLNTNKNKSYINKVRIFDYICYAFLQTNISEDICAINYFLTIIKMILKIDENETKYNEKLKKYILKINKMIMRLKENRLFSQIMEYLALYLHINIEYNSGEYYPFLKRNHYSKLENKLLKRRHLIIMNEKNNI